MGTINYRTNNYITLGINPDDYYNYEEDDYNDALYAMEDDYALIKNELEKHKFWYYDITVKYGYYEGFYLDIESNFPVAFDSWQDKREANKEITEIKAFLLTCANYGLVQVWPGWVTTYKNRAETIQGITEAVKAMREEIATTPTWLQYERAGA